MDRVSLPVTGSIRPRHGRVSFISRARRQPSCQGSCSGLGSSSLDSTTRPVVRSVDYAFFISPCIYSQ